MRTLLLVGAACLGIAACQPQTITSPDISAETDGRLAQMPDAPAFTQRSDSDSHHLTIQEFSDAPTFDLACTKAGPSLVLTAAVAQVGLTSLSGPFSIVLSGGSFPAERLPSADDAEMFAVIAPLTPELVTAVGATTTARIFVDNGNAFAASGVDTGDHFKRFATACTAFTGIAPAP
jgi:hypothetical protein